MLESAVVLNFGGSSVAQIEHWQTIVAQLHAKLSNNQQPILVLSALNDVSNSLEAILHMAVAGDFQTELRALLEKHLHFAQLLNLNIEQAIQDWIRLLEADCKVIYQQQVIKPCMHARVLAFGELLSTTIGTAFIESQGIDVEWVDAREMLIAENQSDEWHHFTSASCDYQHPSNTVKSLLEQSFHRKVIVTQGFIASDQQGHTVLLGREGSDTSAAYLAALFGAKTVEIWTDVPGVFSANPKEVDNAKSIQSISYRQAFVMARSGAKILHPKVIEPLEHKNIRLTVKSTWLPEHSGSIIGESSEPLEKALAVVSELGVTRLRAFNVKALCDKEYILNQLLILGFDLMIDNSTIESLDIWMKYNNSDQPRPDSGEIIKLLNRPIKLVDNNGALVSIVGSQHHQNWQTQAIKVVEHQLQKEIGYRAEHHINPEGDCISFYLNKEDVKSVVNSLHYELIE